MRNLVTMSLSVACLAALLTVAGARDAVSAKTGMKEIVEIAKDADADLLDVVFPAELVEGRDLKEDDVLAWRDGFVAELAAVKRFQVEQNGHDAVATWTEPNGEKAIRIHYTGTRWILDCSQSYLVSGGFLARARGSGPAHVTLVPRPDNSSYAKSAFSFAYATGDPDACKNRMSVWLCKYGDLHSVGDREIAEVGKTMLKKVTGLPLGLEFCDWVEPKKGFVYIVRCARSDRTYPIDFYAKLRVTKVSDESLELDWDLLAAGPGAPPSIHEATPVPDPLDGPDGCDGYCGGKMERR